VKWITVKSFCLLLCATTAQAVVIRHDVALEEYQPESVPDYFVNMPHEGSAALVDEHWLLSAGHVIYYESYVGKKINVHGVENVIEKVIFHPDYKRLPKQPFEGDAKPLIDFLYGRSDLVLIKLAKPVTHVNSVSRYYGKDELYKKTISYGSGALGNGLTGEQLNTKESRRILLFENRIESVSEIYLTMRFDTSNQALALEGIHGSGDSGGPTVINEDGEVLLIGIQSFRDYQGQLSRFQGGIYNSVSVQVRVSAFNHWIDQVIARN